MRPNYERPLMVIRVITEMLNVVFEIHKLCRDRTFQFSLYKSTLAKVLFSSSKMDTTLVVLGVLLFKIVFTSLTSSLCVATDHDVIQYPGVQYDFDARQTCGAQVNIFAT